MSRVGIVGCGVIAPIYAATLGAIDWIEIAAFADGIPERAESFVARYGGEAMAIDELLADPSIDAIVNLTPPHAHVAGHPLDRSKRARRRSARSHWGSSSPRDRR